jgi:hypothetical protein
MLYLWTCSFGEAASFRGSVHEIRSQTSWWNPWLYPFLAPGLQSCAIMSKLLNVWVRGRNMEKEGWEQSWNFKCSLGPEAKSLTTGIYWTKINKRAGERRRQRNRSAQGRGCIESTVLSTFKARFYFAFGFEFPAFIKPHSWSLIDTNADLRGLVQMGNSE